MKKRILLIAAVLTAGVTFAQDGLTSKKGVPILPEAGDYAIGFDAANLLNYGGNLFNDNSDNRFGNLDQIDQNTIYGKYFVSANKAYRGILRLGFNNSNDPGGTAPNGDAAEVDVSSVNITLGAGIEKRRGKGRLQGVYGPMALIGFSSENTDFDYATDIAAGDPPRQIEINSGTTFSASIGAFGGVEYFFAPKISIGAEISWMIGFSTSGEQETIWETPNGNMTVDTEGPSDFTIDLNPNGVLSLNFHF